MSKFEGAMPDTMLHSLVENGSIMSIEKADELRKKVGPASVDLSVSGEVYRLEHLLFPEHDQPIRDLVRDLNPIAHDLAMPLEQGITYLAKLRETLTLPNEIYGYCNPKSSVGRIDVHARVLADGVDSYDTVEPRGFRGELWLAITPNSFPVIVPEGECLSQLRLFNRDTRLDSLEMEMECKKHGFFQNQNGRVLGHAELNVNGNDGSIRLTLDLEERDGQVVCYECRGLNRPLDLARGALAGDYFQPVRPRGGVLQLERGKFYVLSTREALSVPPCFAAEVSSMHDRSGEFRAHYAGFIDPGFKGTLTLEVRPYHNIAFRHGQPVCEIKFERMMAVPELAYGEKGVRHYHGQYGPHLSKYMKV